MDKELKVVPQAEMQVAGISPVAIDPKAEVAFAAKCADALMEVISKKKDKLVIHGQQYMEFEDWQTIARFYQCTVSVEWVKPLTVTDNEGKTQFVGYEARAAVYDQAGIIRSAAEANCSIQEAKWRSRDRFQLKSMAQTRACSKALRNVFAWVVIMAGFKPTPAEEFPEYEEPKEPQNPLADLPPKKGSVGGLNPLATDYDDPSSFSEPITPTDVDAPEIDREQPASTGAHCLECGQLVADVVRDYSRNWYNGVVLCRDCQGLEKWLKTKKRQ